MKTYLSLLRGINVSGQNKIRMVELRDLYDSLGFSAVETYLQSGNVVFDSDEEDRTMIAHSIELAIEQTLGYSVAVLIRDKGELQQVVACQPFQAPECQDPTKLLVTFLAEVPSQSALDNLPFPDEAGDRFQVVGPHVYLCCPGGYGSTKYSNAFLERKLKVTATTRNWKTVTALWEMMTR